MSIQNHQSFVGQVSDGLLRTEFFESHVLPTIPGSYECGTGSGHIFRRTFDGTNWLSPMDGKTVSTVRMPWRGVKPGFVRADAYPKEIRAILRADDELRESLHQNGIVDMNDPNIGALAA